MLKRPVVFCLIEDGSLGLLLIRRMREPDLGLWTLPGGHMEYGELPEAACQREISEETGLSVKVKYWGCLDIFGEGYLRRCVYYKGIVTAGEPVNTEEGEVAWLPGSGPNVSVFLKLLLPFLNQNRFEGVVSVHNGTVSGSYIR